jgi:crotonobetainyl-CoA:carnitine CoA-transferase CaiB-like acyl-CoA transferase
MSDLVLDLTRLFPGPLCTKMLHTMGFRVLRLLPPGGDMLEQVDQVTFAWLQRGKEVEIVDLKTKQGISRLEELAVQAAAVVENNLPGKMEALGVGPDQLSKLNPGLVYARLAGVRDPKWNRVPGHDLTYLASAGLLDTLDPAWRTVRLADLCGAFWAVMAVLDGLRKGGGFYEIYIEEAALAVPWPKLAQLEGSQCCYTIYPASDGDVALAALESHLWERFCSAASHAEWKDAAFTPTSAENPAYAQIRAFIQSQTVDHWERWAAATNVPLRAVKTNPNSLTGAPWRRRNSPLLNNSKL